MPVVPKKKKNAGGANANAGDADINAGSVDIAAMNVPTASAGDIPPCQTCMKYRQLLSDVLLDTLKFCDTISSMSSSSSNFLNLSIRKASAFNLLYEAVVLKETAGVAPPVKHSKSYRIAAVN